MRLVFRLRKMLYPKYFTNHQFHKQTRLVFA